ncbi:MAG: hypothetical protein HW406_2892 [Candidatus Brocadiaceae bacterium]|nr:hypothetical protein [Candidatus Brocadiaceae bacterium]
MKYIQYLFVISFLFFVATSSFAHGNIVDYFLKNPNAWDDTRKIIHKTPTKVFIPDGLEDVGDKLLPGKNRVVSVITRNSGDRTLFHYKFMLQRNIHNVPISFYNNGNAVLESRYDGSQPVKDISNLAGIELCEVDIR